MPEFAEIIALAEANWPAIALVLALAVLLAAWLHSRRKAQRRTRHRAPDALDEGAAPAARNQALIDAPSAVTAARLADSGPDIMAGIGAPIAAAAAAALAPPPPPVAVIPSPAAKAAPKPKAEPKPKAAARPMAKVEPKPKAPPKPKAEPKPKPPAKTKAAPAPKAKGRAVPKPAAASPPPAPKPVASPPAPPVEAATPPPAPAGGPEGLSRIKGLGPKLQTLLPTLGITTLAQIAAWDEAETDRIDAQLGVFAGRVRKDSWVEQAKFLAAGDVAGYEAKFGKL